MGFCKIKINERAMCSLEKYPLLLLLLDFDLLFYIVPVILLRDHRRNLPARFSPPELLSCIPWKED